MKKITMLWMMGIIVSNMANAEGDRQQNCTVNGSNLAICAADWERAFRNGGVLENNRDAWNTASFQAFVDGASMAEIRKIWCLKSAVTGQEIYAITAKYIRENPDKWSNRPVDLVLESLAKSFPCNHTSKIKEVK